MKPLRLRPCSVLRSIGCRTTSRSRTGAASYNIVEYRRTSQNIVALVPRGGIEPSPIQLKVHHFLNGDFPMYLPVDPALSSRSGGCDSVPPYPSRVRVSPLITASGTAPPSLPWRAFYRGARATNAHQPIPSRSRRVPTGCMRNPSLSKEEKSEKQRLSACHRRHCRGAGARRQAGLKPWNAEHAAGRITKPLWSNLVP
jgi:hypothetical protein